MKMTKFFEKDKPWDSCGDGTLDDPEVFLLSSSLYTATVDSAVDHLAKAARGPKSEGRNRAGLSPPGYSRVPYSRLAAADGQLLEGHVYCVIDGQSGKFMAREARKHARDGQDQPVQLHNFDLRPKRRTKLVSRLLQDYEAWRKIQGPLFQQNA
ncbi:uncharacterized protein NECHADRAFT_88696 [Fusarium vanettenii 77-13-4]|uniref:Uncharacterized protein n=1 Tax=Fusarium vanettenii (strain ATCC MYA-4622 / CBS 123669 / FGSC 9596 / NRRL 45880 / 77-13-4) TaxID=660122 RepID=C7ZLJ3_FUSV7|nr:uncharacterized protein NECHADRAFT_88696 [Fusarium vanettenii 77-13-4]EEU35126.1 predicted protein [Fusarium vanettenii 77-13-4]